MSTPKQEQQGVYPKAVVEGESRSVNPSPNFPQAEEKVISYWDKDQTFEKSLKINPSGQKAHNEYVFFDGPPFANGLPHYGHLLTGYTKDAEVGRWMSPDSRYTEMWDETARRFEHVDPLNRDLIPEGAMLREFYASVL